MVDTPQRLGRQWESTLARLVGGTPQPGSGNLIQARGDVAGAGALLWSAKHTIHLSSPITKAAIADAQTLAAGPSVASAPIVVFGYKLGDGTMRADLDLMQLLAWIREPPALVPSTPQDQIRKTARTPSFMRD